MDGNFHMKIINDYWVIKETLISVCNINATVKTVRVTKREAPWIT